MDNILAFQAPKKQVCRFANQFDNAL